MNNSRLSPSNARDRLVDNPISDMQPNVAMKVATLTRLFFWASNTLIIEACYVEICRPICFAIQQIALCLQELSTCNRQRAAGARERRVALLARRQTLRAPLYGNNR